MPRLCEAIQETAFENGYGVLTRSHHNDPDKLPDVVQYFIDRRNGSFDFHFGDIRTR